HEHEPVLVEGRVPPPPRRLARPRLLVAEDGDVHQERNREGSHRIVAGRQLAIGNDLARLLGPRLGVLEVPLELLALLVAPIGEAGQTGEAEQHGEAAAAADVHPGRGWFLLRPAVGFHVTFSPARECPAARPPSPGRGGRPAPSPGARRAPAGLSPAGWDGDGTGR